MSKTGWVVAAVVASVGSCCALGGLVMAVGAASDSDVPTARAVVAAGAGRAPRATAAAGDDDFIFVTSEGLTYLSTARTIARGQPVALAGLWREDRTNFSLQLDSGGSYELQSSGGSSGGGALTVETGSWSTEGLTLRLTPTEVSLQTVHLPSKHQETTGQDPGGARDYAVEGLRLEYVPYGRPGASARQVDGLSFAGATPSWGSEPSGRWDKTLRRAPR